MKDTFFLEAIFRQALKSNSRDSTHRSVAHPFGVNERKDSLLHLITLEALMRILDCLLLDNYPGSVPAHVQFIFRMLPTTIAGLDCGEFRSNLMDVPSRSRRYLVVDVLEELSKRVCKGNGMLSQAGGRLEDQVLPDLLDVYASSTFRAVSSAVWLGNGEETDSDEAPAHKHAGTSVPVLSQNPNWPPMVSSKSAAQPAATTISSKGSVKATFRKITRLWGEKR